jgi:hypothetical protein
MQSMQSTTSYNWYHCKYNFKLRIFKEKYRLPTWNSSSGVYITIWVVLLLAQP